MAEAQMSLWLDDALSRGASCDSGSAFPGARKACGAFPNGRPGQLSRESEVGTRRRCQ
jgi:hypothetical protein